MTFNSKDTKKWAKTVDKKWGIILGRHTIIQEYEWEVDEIMQQSSNQHVIQPKMIPKAALESQNY